MAPVHACGTPREPRHALLLRLPVRSSCSARSMPGSRCSPGCRCSTGSFEGPPRTFSPRDWHIHEMLYGYLPAVVGLGFLLHRDPELDRADALARPPARGALPGASTTWARSSHNRLGLAWLGPGCRH